MDLRKIDWLNHFIAFASSVIGIFIAFQLDDWQERRSKREEMNTTLKAIKEEIEGNLFVFHENDSALGALVDFYDFYIANQHDGGLLFSNKDLLEAQTKFPGRLNGPKVIQKVNDTLAIYQFKFTVDVAPASGISTGNWEAAITSGILANLDHDRTVLLTQIYDWTTKDLGYSEDELYATRLGFKEFEDVDQILEHYRMIVKVSRFKHAEMKRYYNKVKW